MLSNVFAWMPKTDLIILLSFLAVAGTVAAATGIVVLRRVACRLRRQPGRPKRRWRRNCERAIVVMGLAGLVCLGYARFIEPGWLDVTRAVVTTAKLPAEANPIRIALVSDLHCNSTPGLVDDLPKEIAALKPDIICFTGDALNVPAGLVHFQKCMTELATIAPTFAVWGNWEHFERFEGCNFYAGTGVRVLHDGNQQIFVRGQRINVLGIRHQVDLAKGLKRAIGDVDTGLPTVLLCHIPSIILALPETGVDLCLSGHVHGGQIALPFYGALITLTSTGKQFEQGLYEHEGTHLYVSRGIGTEDALRMRFFARPEVTLIELAPQP